MSLNPSELAFLGLPKEYFHHSSVRQIYSTQNSGTSRTQAAFSVLSFESQRERDIEILVKASVTLVATYVSALPQHRCGMLHVIGQSKRNVQAKESGEPKAALVSAAGKPPSYLK